MLSEYSAFRKTISKSILQELAFIDDDALRQDLWEEAKTGRLTIRGLRETKKNPEAMRDREKRSAATGTSGTADPAHPVDLPKLIASAQKNIKRTSIDIAALKQRKAKLDDGQRAAFRALRDQLNDLIGN